MKINWQPKTVNVTDLHPAEYNPRRMNKKAKKSFVKNYEEFGNLEPIVINFDGTIIGGHMRYFLAIERGDTDMEVFAPDILIGKEDEKELNIILNSVTGRTVMEKLSEMGITQDVLDELGFREFRIPVIKVADKAVVEAGKQKNPSVLALFYEVDDLIEIKRVLKAIIKNVPEVEGVAGAIIYLEKYA